VRAALLGQPVTIYGDGQQTRCFCHVQDTVRARWRCSTTPPTHSGEIYNIGASDEITIEQLARTVIERTESSAPIAYIPYSEAYAPGFEDMRRRVPDTTKAYQAIHWLGQAHPGADSGRCDRIRTRKTVKLPTATLGKGSTMTRLFRYLAAAGLSALLLLP
jgi:hypothetical protein